MPKIISVNAGSSSLKFQLFEMPSEEVLTSGIVERIGFEDAIFTIKVNGEKFSKTLPIENHEVAVNMLLEALVEHNVVASLDEITAAGHRVVHGGELYSGSVVFDGEVEANVEKLADLAPLHNPANLVGYRAFKAALPHAGHAAIFDTAFHQTMEKAHFLYPIPMEFYEKYGVRRYGFHGTSHQYVSQRAAAFIGKDVADAKIITCHLGNGASICAVDQGKSVNTSMGFTPLAGVMMGTRSGDIDPAIVSFLAKKLDMGADGVIDILNKKSGMLGVSGISSDAREIEDAFYEGNEDAILTTDMYTNRVVAHIGAYFLQMGGLDAIVFTGGIGENDANIRKHVSLKLKALGVDLDEALNAKSRGKEIELSTADSKVKVLLIPTNEELVIARDTFSVLGF
ncbi:MAG: acetate/propionate family kinase [Erysipelotrichaceae bacterium]